MLKVQVVVLHILAAESCADHAFNPLLNWQLDQSLLGVNAELAAMELRCFSPQSHSRALCLYALAAALGWDRFMGWHGAFNLAVR